MKRLAPLAILLLCSWAVSSLAGQVNKLIHVRVRDLQDPRVVSFLRTWPDVASYDPRRGVLVVFATARDLSTLDSLGLSYHVQIEDLAKLEAQMRAGGYFDYFHDYSECKQELEWAQTNYPALAKLYDIGDSWEKTQGLADRDILAVKISDNVGVEEEEPEVAIISNHHAREIITPEIAVYLVHYLLERYGSDPLVTYLVDHRQIWIVPTMNPDGLDYVHTTDRWWRKNRRLNRDGTYGVDLNRNYSYKWAYDNVGSSPDPGSPIYRGEAPFSEPETQAIRDLCMQHRFRIILSFHSYSRLYLFPWGYIRQNTPDHWVFASLADSMAHYNGYLPGNPASGAIYITNGDSDDWFYGEQTVKNKIFGFTPEVGTAFHPDTSEIAQLIQENLQPILYAIWAAGEEPIVDVFRVPDTEDAVGPYAVRARIRPAITLTDSCVLDPSTFRLHYSFDAAQYDSVQMTPTTEPDVYVGEIPGRGEHGPIFFYVTAWSVDGRRGAWPRPAPAAVDTFWVRPDSVPPRIVHEPLADQSAFSGTYRVAAEIWDDAGIDSAWVEFWTEGGPVGSVPMVPEGDEFVAQIALYPPVAGQRIHYVIYARDGSSLGNVARDPAQGSHSFSLLAYRVYDFEDDSVLTVVSGTDWQWGVPTSGPGSAHSGQKLWATNLDGNYSNSADARLVTPEIDLRNAESAVFRFWHWYRFEYSSGRLWDGGNVKISVDGGPFEVVEPTGKGYDHVVDPYNRVLGGERAFGGPEGTGDFWHPAYIDLRPYVGHRVVLQFHLGSDNNTNESGWYIDDVSWSVERVGAPSVMVVRRPHNTDDATGPYAVLAQAWDDSALARVTLVWMAEDTTHRLPMLPVGHDSLYRAEIPGQPFGTEIHLYVEVEDASGNKSVDPLGAPRTYYAFRITDVPAQVAIDPSALSFRLRQGETAADTLWLANGGEVDLVASVAVQGGGLGEAAQVSRLPVRLPRTTFSASAEEWADARWRKGDLQTIDGSVAPGTGAEELGKLQLGAAVLQLRGERLTGGTTYLWVWPRGRYYALVPRTDRAEVGLFDARDGHLLAVFPLRMRGEAYELAIPRRALGSGWSRLIWADGSGEVLAAASTGPASWLKVAPDSVLVPAGMRFPLRVEVEAVDLQPGEVRATLLLNTNDPQHPQLAVPVTVQIEPQTKVVREGGAVVTAFALYPAFPNPFNPATVVRYALPRAARVRLELFNSRGERVRTLVRGRQTAGEHEARWDGCDEYGRPVAAGVYVCRFTAETDDGAVWQRSQKLLLLR